LPRIIIFLAKPTEDYFLLNNLNPLYFLQLVRKWSFNCDWRLILFKSIFLWVNSSKALYYLALT